jgi:SMC interacting uncharacterized protein involved in chromosome segregation
MANLNAEQAYVLSLLKEISNLNNQLENMELERNCAASHADEFQLENKKLREKFNALKSDADDFKAENKALKESLTQSQTEHQIALEALHNV